MVDEAGAGVEEVGVLGLSSDLLGVCFAGVGEGAGAEEAGPCWRAGVTAGVGT